MSAPGVPLEELTLDQWQSVVNINLTAPFLCTREAIKWMKKSGGGRVINNGSISAYTPRPSEFTLPFSFYENTTNSICQTRRLVLPRATIRSILALSVSRRHGNETCDNRPDQVNLS